MNLLCTMNSISVLAASRLAPITIPHERLIDRMADAWSNDVVVLVSDKLPKFVVILIVAFVLFWLLRLGTRRLRWLAKRDVIVKASRSAQLHTLAGVIDTAGLGLIAFIAIIHTLQIFSINVAPLL